MNNEQISSNTNRSSQYPNVNRPEPKAHEPAQHWTENEPAGPDAAAQRTGTAAHRTGEKRSNTAGRKRKEKRMKRQSQNQTRREPERKQEEEAEPEQKERTVAASKTDGNRGSKKEEGEERNDEKGKVLFSFLNSFLDLDEYMHVFEILSLDPYREEEEWPEYQKNLKKK